MEKQILIDAWKKMENMSEEPERTHIHKVIEKLQNRRNMTEEQDNALAMDLCRIIKPLAHDIISAIGDNRVLICIQPHAGICADINGSKYLVSWADTYEKSETNN